jgi:hypothetical protein
MLQIVINLYCRKKSYGGIKHIKKGKIRKKKETRKKKKTCRPLYLINQIKIKTPDPVSGTLPISIKPIVQRYFYIPPDDINLAEGTVIFSNQFIDDNGEPVHELADFGQAGYFNLFINGVLQEGKLFGVTSETLTIAPTEQNISRGTPIIIESIGFAAECGKIRI